jgi:transcriptional regulator with XRE-family HTH domain
MKTPSITTDINGVEVIVLVLVPTPLADVEQLADLRKRAGLTLAELAGRMGCSRTQVHRLERAERIELASLRRYADGLGLSIVLDNGCVRLAGAPRMVRRRLKRG